MRRAREIGEALERGKGRVGGRWEVSEIDRSVGSLVNVRGMLDHMVSRLKKRSTQMC